MSGPHKTVNRHSGIIRCACSCFICFFKQIERHTSYRANIPCLSLWERWPSAARTERVNNASARLVIELDGSQHYEPQGLAYDAERSQFLMSLGLEILRFSNRDIDRDFRGVCAHKLILSFEKGCKTLSVTCGDSSPKGRAFCAQLLRPKISPAASPRCP